MNCTNCRIAANQEFTNAGLPDVDERYYEAVDQKVRTASCSEEHPICQRIEDVQEAAFAVTRVGLKRFTQRSFDVTEFVDGLNNDSF
jgi:hypothetical protein